jgi:hypothetical protein
MRKLVFKLQKKQLPDHDVAHNALGFKTYEIIQFNYDGKGYALVLEDGRLSLLAPGDLYCMMFDGWYKLQSVK